MPHGDSQSLLLAATVAMMEACNFVPSLAMAAKSRQEINPLVDSAHGDKTLSIILGNRITEAIKYKKNQPK